jgi:hypothetical protein
MQVSSRVLSGAEFHDPEHTGVCSCTSTLSQDGRPSSMRPQHCVCAGTRHPVNAAASTDVSPTWLCCPTLVLLFDHPLCLLRQTQRWLHSCHTRALLHALAKTSRCGPGRLQDLIWHSRVSRCRSQPRAAAIPRSQSHGILGLIWGWRVKFCNC